ncbi:hypothetical protein DB91_04065 [Ehrlichia sp. Wisconsin_h]|uniref:Uncharacterized protein n=2 Tax=Ehrlichia muris TaxID=35795 RepID=A0A0F3N8U9_9RICK|nr:hypothetical protein [Ehrlichia sp. Wisconsin_h]KJV63354.1 hypothetical protein EMUCRT_0808 [Ehrlichia cf. muris str. EmCRT]OUC04155.1 hypothetical protein DB91_04065 [Ehrlichia sp. Wisconsin_h]
MYLQIKNKKLTNTLEQVRMVCLLIYIVGAVLFLLKHYNVIDSNLNKISNWLVGLSVIMFLVLSCIKFINCVKKPESNEVQLLKNDHNSCFVQDTKNCKRINGITIFRYMSNVIFAGVCVVTSFLLLSSLYVQETLFLTVYSVVLMTGSSLAGLYFIARFLGAGLGVCSHVIDNMNTRRTKCGAIDFIVSEVYSQLSVSSSKGYVNEIVLS